MIILLIPEFSFSHYVDDVPIFGVRFNLDNCALISASLDADDTSVGCGWIAR